MTAMRFAKFLGYAPKSAPELLSDTAAQVAVNVKFYSGDLLPYRTPVVNSNIGRNGTIQSIYPMRNPADSSDLKWLSWLGSVDVATTTALDDAEQRIYYTGDGVPKVTNYALAVQGSVPYPTAAYDLGLPLPTQTFGAAAASAATSTTVTYARDGGNVATIVTAGPHGLKTGAFVAVSGFTATDASTFNVTSSQITVINSTTFTYYSIGNAVSGSDNTGSVGLAGNTIARNYVYTWVTPWGEESVPSSPSTTLYLREGQVVTLTDLPNSPPAGNNFIRGIRIYRTITGTNGTSYFRVAEVWFPLALDSASRTSNLVTMKVASNHNLLVGDKIKISGTAFGGVPDTSFDVTDITVQSVVDNYTFTYLAAGADKALTNCSAGTLYWDTAEPGVVSSRYYTGTTFIDDFNYAGLAIELDSLNADPPDPGMQGIIAAQNNILAGFVGNEVCFSDVGRPWSWPSKYRLVLEYPIVALAAVGGQIAALTTKYVYRISGSDPSSMAYDRADAPYPCLSKRGVLNVGYGVIFPSYGGLAVFQSGGGLAFVTRIVHDWDTWPVSLDPSTLVAAFYAGKYFGSHSSGAFIFEQDEKTGGYFTDVGAHFTAAYYDSRSNRFYYVSDTSGTLMEWDPIGQPLLPMEWKSKVILTKGYMNFGAARVVGEYATPSLDADAVATYNATVAPFNTSIWSQISQLGTVDGPSPLDYIHPISGSPLSVSGALNSFPVNGDPFTISKLVLTGVYPVNFKLWANKVLVLDTNIVDSNIFRLPTGYRADTLEFSVSGSARIKSIHIGETPNSLRDA
jgi:hypothetical protein